MSNPSCLATADKRLIVSSIAAWKSSSKRGLSQLKERKSGLGALPGCRAAGGGKADGEVAWER